MSGRISSWGDFWIGFFLVSPVFFDLSSPFFLANSALTEGGLAFPFSVLFCVFSLYLACDRFRSSFTLYEYLFIICGLGFVSFLTVLAFFGAVISINSFLYMFQWLVPFFWLPYFLSLDRVDFFSDFLRGVVGGAIFSVFFIFMSGVLEIALYGALLDFGRMTQNKVLPGQYQLYVYTPTVIAYSLLFSNWIFRSGFVKITRANLFLLNFFGFFSLAFLAAREAVVIFLLGLSIVYVYGSFYRLFLLICYGFIAVLILTLSISYWMPNLDFESIRVLDKFSRLADNSTGGRDEMAIIYAKVISRDFFSGTLLLPPSYVYPELNVEAPSAHNYYIDALAWTGLGGAIFIYLLIFLGLVKSISISWFCKSARDPISVLAFGISVMTVIFFVLSNSVNVPFRQPLTAPIALFFLVFCVFLYPRLRK